MHPEELDSPPSENERLRTPIPDSKSQMSRTFAYVRSTVGQTTEDQIREIEGAGFKVDRRRVVSETVSGSSAIARRPGFQQLLNRLEQDDILIVTKLDRLGRDAIDVSSTVAKLAELGVRVHCLTLGGVDLTSAAGRMTMGVINHVAQFERDLLIERTNSGLERAKASVDGKKNKDHGTSSRRGDAAHVSGVPMSDRHALSIVSRLTAAATPTGPVVARRSTAEASDQRRENYA
nr:recombinase family protein [Acidisoma sp. S159]